MNKFLMMSAAAVMGTTAVAPHAQAGTRVGTFFLSACTEMFLYQGKAGTYAAFMSSCGGSFITQGFPVKGKIGGFKKSLELGYNALHTTTNFSSLQFELPIQNGSKWNAWDSTNGTTGVIYYSSTISVHRPAKRPGPTLAERLSAILRDRQK